MGVGLTLSGHDPGPHGTEIYPDRRDFRKLSDWVRSLPRGDYPAVDEFMEGGRYTGTDALMLQLNDAALEHPPPADGTDAAVELLLDRLGGGYPDETAELDH